MSTVTLSCGMPPSDSVTFSSSGSPAVYESPTFSIHEFTAFNNAYASLSAAIENANKAIQDKIKQEAADQAKEDIDAQIGEVDQSVKDEIAKQLGYTDYENLKYYAERGMSIIKGGTINTEVLEASLVITSQLIANAIMANTLNVNNKFKVYTDGSVDMSGVFRSLGGKMECIIYHL